MISEPDSDTQSDKSSKKNWPWSRKKSSELSASPDDIVKMMIQKQEMNSALISQRLVVLEQNEVDDEVSASSSLLEPFGNRSYTC
jgi:hypothetical protein